MQPAGKIMAVNFGSFDKIQLGCAGVLLLCLGVTAALSRKKFGPVFRLVLAIFAAAALIYSVQFLTPKIESLQATVATAEAESEAQKTFDEFHDSAVRISTINLGLLAVVLISLGWAGPARTLGAEGESQSPPGTDGSA